MITWAMSSFGVQKIPNNNAIRAIMEKLQSFYSVMTTCFEGSLGHVYYINDLATLIAQVFLIYLNIFLLLTSIQEVANPKVHPHLSFFPEDASQVLENANQAQHWLHELSPKLLTPVIQQHGQQFFIFEPAILDNKDIVIPFCFFKCKDASAIFAHSWCMYPYLDGWLVYKFEELTLPASRLLTSFPYFCASHNHQSLPNPENILGTICRYNGQIAMWSLTNPKVGKKWCKKAKGIQFMHFQSGFIAMTLMETCQRNGTNIIPFYLLLLDFHISIFIMNIMCIFYAPPTLHLHLKCLKEL